MTRMQEMLFSFRRSPNQTESQAKDPGVTVNSLLLGASQANHTLSDSNACENYSLVFRADHTTKVICGHCKVYFIPRKDFT